MKPGDKLRDEGMQLSLFNAELKVPLWGARALSFLIEYLTINPYKAFQTEDVRTWAYASGLPTPLNCRAWGSVISNAKKNGLIEFVGHENVDNPLAHSTPAAVWRKDI